VFTLEIVFVTVKLVLTIPGVFVTLCQQMGGDNVLVDSRWVVGPLVAQESTALFPVVFICRLGLSPDEARKLSPYTLLPEESGVCEQSPITETLNTRL